MAQWQNDTTLEIWDDGMTAVPGEAGFTRDLAATHFGGPGFSYVGTPNWIPASDAAPPASASPAVIS